MDSALLITITRDVLEHGKQSNIQVSRKQKPPSLNLITFMRFAEIRYDSAEYRMECELRQSVLRALLELNLYDEDLTAEHD